MIKQMFRWIMLSFCGGKLFAGYFDPEVIDIHSDLEKYIIPNLRREAKRYAYHMQKPLHEVGLEEIRIFIYIDNSKDLEDTARIIQKSVMKGVAKSKHLLKYTNHGLTSPSFVGITFYNPNFEILGCLWNGIFYQGRPNLNSYRNNKRFSEREIQKLSNNGAFRIDSDSSYYFTSIEEGIDAVGIKLYIDVEDESLKDRNLEWFCSLYRKLVPVVNEMFPGKFLMLHAGSSNKKIEESFFENVRNNVVHTKRSEVIPGREWNYEISIESHQLDDVVPASLQRELQNEKKS